MGGMQPVQRRNNACLIIALVMIGLIVIGAIGFTIFIRNFLNSPEGMRMKAAIGTSQRLETALPNVVDALEKYTNEKKAWPESLDEVATYGATAESLSVVKELMKYKKPANDAPDDTVILDSGKLDFIRGSEMHVQVTKDFKSYQITKAPLDGSRMNIKL